jgi:hypothetical protein
MNLSMAVGILATVVFIMVYKSIFIYIRDMPYDNTGFSDKFNRNASHIGTLVVMGIGGVLTWAVVTILQHYWL